MQCSHENQYCNSQKSKAYKMTTHMHGMAKDQSSISQSSKKPNIIITNTYSINSTLFTLAADDDRIYSKLYQQRSNMQRALPSKNSRSFLQKFQGKKNAISREGLLHLLDVKKQSLDDLPQPKEKQKVILLREPKLDPLAHPKESRGDRARSNGKDPAAGHPAFVVNDLQERYARMRQELREPKSVQLGNGSKVRLPAINKSSSHSTHLHKKNAETAPAEHSEDFTGQRMRSMPRKLQGESGDGLMNNLGKKIELDKYALRHLQFLDKFEKQLLQNDTVGKKTSRSEYH